MAGNTVALRCNVSGVPSPRITWIKDGSTLDNHSQVLVLKLLSLSDSGTYECIATSVDGSDVQKINVNILGKYPLSLSPKCAFCNC